MLHHRKRRPHGPSGWLRGAGEHCVYPLEVRKATLASTVAKARPGIRFNEHIEGDGPTVFAHACKGVEGIV